MHIEKYLHPWDKSQLIVVCDPFNVVEFSLLGFVRYLCVYVHQ